MGLTVLIIPMCLLCKLPWISSALTVRSRKGVLLVTGIAVGYTYGIWGKYVEIETRKYEMRLEVHSPLNILIEMIVGYGVYIMALMSAYGAVWCPYIYFNYFKTQKQELTQAKKKTQEEIHFIIDQIKHNKLHLLLLKEQSSSLEAKLREKSEQEGKMSLFARGFKTLTSFAKDSTEDELEILRKKQGFHKQEL